MIVCKLVTALDFAHDASRPVEEFSFRRDDGWFVQSNGHTYANTLEVTKYDADGLRLLEQKERKLS